MPFILLFVIAAGALFGFAQLMGMHKKEKTLAGSMYDKAQKAQKELEKLKQKGFSLFKKPAKRWWEFWKK